MSVCAGHACAVQSALLDKDAGPSMNVIDLDSTDTEAAVASMRSAARRAGRQLSTAITAANRFLLRHPWEREALCAALGDAQTLRARAHRVLKVALLGGNTRQLPLFEMRDVHVCARALRARARVLQHVLE